MCGIIGSVTNSPLLQGTIDALHDIQKYRGPDGFGQFNEITENQKYLTFLHQRLAIIDLNDGIQPMTDTEQSVTIVFNGEIFNHVELRKALLQKGYQFKTDHSDTEVLINLYKEYQEEMLQHLNGMFAFVIYDHAKNLLFMARDQTGIKPLYYTHINDQFYFASELKTILEYGATSAIDMQSLSNYLSFQFVPAPQTIFENISKLEAGHYLSYDIKKNTLTKKRYWKLSFSTQEKSIQEWEEAILYQLEASVKSWAISDVEVGASLSGGIDSSAIVALYAKNADRKIKTFSLGFEGDFSYLDERKLANSVAKQYNTEHFEFVLTQNMLMDEINAMIYHLDEPYAGGFPSWYIYKMMKGKIKVALTGSGGDELFGNYNKAQIFESFSLRKLKKLYQSGKIDCTQTLNHLMNYPQGFFYPKYFSGLHINHLLLKKDVIHPEQIIQKLIEESKEEDFKNIVPYIDFQMQLPEEFLHVTDRFSMAHSIEARTPFLDTKMIRLIMSIPTSIRTKYKDPKYLLKNSVASLLPKELISAPKKGFVMPQAEWIRTILKEKVHYFLGEEYISKQNIFLPSIYKEYVLPHMQGKQNNHWQIWTLLMFQLWYEKYKGSIK